MTTTTERDLTAAISASERRSAWQQLRQQEIDCDRALELLIGPEGELNVEWLDREVAVRFFQAFSDRERLPPVVPLLLWRSRYYLGSPVAIGSETIALMASRTLMDVEILPISERSYLIWYHARNYNPDTICATPLHNPLTGERDFQEDISATTQHYLAKAVDQIGRIKTIISGALRNRASDIHLEPTPEGLKVRYRIDGMLRPVTLLPAELSRRVIGAIKVMSGIDIATNRIPQDGRIGESYLSGEERGIKIDMRVSTLPCVGGEKAVVRLLPQENPFSSLDNLGFAESPLAIYKSWLRQPQGMVILTGPTGSGKTSTLYTSLQAISTEAVNVITIEDPVEYMLPGITQTQVNEAAGMTFAAGMRAILRQDPDIIMVGEIRDEDTAETAVRAALTGHLVFTTLHTNDAVGAVPRLRDIGPDPGLISDALLGVVAQRLARKICPHCAEPHHPSDEELRLLCLERAQVDLTHWQKGRGCMKCFGTGYLGREAIIELLDVDETLRQMVYEGRTDGLQTYLQGINFASFGVGAILKVTQGLTTVEEVLRVLPRSAFQRLRAACKE